MRVLTLVTTHDGVGGDGRGHHGVSDAVPVQGVSPVPVHGVSDGAAQGVSAGPVLQGVSVAVAVHGVSAGAAWAVVAARTGRRTAAAIAVRAGRIRTVVSLFVRELMNFCATCPTDVRKARHRAAIAWVSQSLSSGLSPPQWLRDTAGIAVLTMLVPWWKPHPDSRAP